MRVEIIVDHNNPANNKILLDGVNIVDDGIIVEITIADIASGDYSITKTQQTTANHR